MGTLFFQDVHWNIFCKESIFNIIVLFSYCEWRQKLQSLCISCTKILTILNHKSVLNLSYNKININPDNLKPMISILSIRGNFYKWTVPYMYFQIIIIWIYVQMTMRRKTKHLTTLILMSFCPTVENFLLYTLCLNRLFYTRVLIQL